MLNFIENSRSIKFLLLFLTILSFSNVLIRLILYSQDATPNSICPNNCTTYGPLNLGVASWGLNSSHHPIPGSSSVSDNGLEAIQSFNQTFNNFKETIFICFNPKRIKCYFPNHNPDNKSSHIGLSITTLIIELIISVILFCSLFLFGTWKSTPSYY